MERSNILCVDTPHYCRFSYLAVSKPTYFIPSSCLFFYSYFDLFVPSFVLSWRLRLTKLTILFPACHLCGCPSPCAIIPCHPSFSDMQPHYQTYIYTKETPRPMKILQIAERGCEIEARLTAYTIKRRRGYSYREPESFILSLISVKAVFCPFYRVFSDYCRILPTI
jgi:hypothetical protein